MPIRTPHQRSFLHLLQGIAGVSSRALVQRRFTRQLLKAATGHGCVVRRCRAAQQSPEPRARTCELDEGHLVGPDLHDQWSRARGAASDVLVLGGTRGHLGGGERGKARGARRRFLLHMGHHGGSRHRRLVRL